MRYKDFEYEIIDNEIRITKYNGRNPIVFVPTSIDDHEVAIIGEQAFYGHFEIDLLFLPDCLKKIEKIAFSHTGITFLYIPKACTTIEAEAFSYTQRLKNVFIAKNIRDIDPSAFMACPQLEVFYVETNNPYYSSVDGILFSKDLTSLIRYPEGKQDSTYVVPETVTRIENNAFVFSGYIKNIVLPQNIKYIGPCAFVKCGITEIVIPDSVSYMGEGVFYNCKQLKKITLSHHLLDIKQNTFMFCTKLLNITIPKNVAILDCFAFMYCNPDLIIKVYENCELENREALDLNIEIIE